MANAGKLTKPFGSLPHISLGLPSIAMVPWAYPFNLQTPKSFLWLKKAQSYEAPKSLFKKRRPITLSAIKYHLNFFIGALLKHFQ